MPETTEGRRLAEQRAGVVDWRGWGPYLSERVWGTVREDYSFDGTAWDYFPHDHARSRAYRWNEDGLAGICDRDQQLCFALALWNEADPILKERLFGLTNAEGNHGEDVKEYYFYLDNTPTHSYMRMLYKYPQAAFPYDLLVRENARHGKQEPEYELLDTGVFHDSRYFDVCVEYAKAGPEDILIRIGASNRGQAEGPLHILPTLWYRNTWSWTQDGARPTLYEGAEPRTQDLAIWTEHPVLGRYCLCCEGTPELLFTENDTNYQRLFGVQNPGPYVKDAFHACLIRNERAAINPQRRGTKAAAHYAFSVEGDATATIRLRLVRLRDGQVDVS